MPVVKIFSVILVYKIGAAIVEPIGEENISSFMDETSKLMTVLLVSVLEAVTNQTFHYLYFFPLLYNLEIH